MKKTTFLIVGKHPVLEALKNPSRKIDRVFLTEDAQKKLNRENQNLNLFKKINVFYKSRKELDNLCGRDETAHQGLVAEVEQLEEITLKEFIFENKKQEFDKVFDSHGITIFCDVKSWIYVRGCEIDFSSDLLNGGFKVNNPNATRTCGCGISFSA